jgi:predicted GIY-YIG superfamily endonuclease
MSSDSLISAAREIVPHLAKAVPVVYILRLRSGVHYVGASMDLEQRLHDHASGRACRTTQLDPPFALLRVEVCSTFREARRREGQLKGWSRPKKEALIRGDLEMLRALSRSRD